MNSIRSVDVARRRLMNTGLSVPSTEKPEEIVRKNLAVQAQDYGPTKWAVGMRTVGSKDGDVERAVTSGAIVRTHVLRPTWHFVARKDIRWLLALTGPRVEQHNGSRLRDLGLDGRTLSRCERVIASALEQEGRLLRGAIAEHLERKRIDASDQRLHYILMHCELEAVICSGGYEGTRHTYALLDERVPPASRFDRDRALVEMTRRYLSGHGPATINDLRWWSSLTVKDIRAALEDLGDEVRSEEIEDVKLWSLSEEPSSAPKPTGAHLLQPFDEMIVGYTESRYFGDPLAAEGRAAWGDRTQLRGLVLVDGRIAGRWRRMIHKDSVTIEVMSYGELKPSAIRSVEKAGKDLGRFLGLPTIMDWRRK